MKYFLNIRILIFLLIGINAMGWSTSDTSITKTAFEQDLAILQQSLVANHSGVFQYIGSENLNKQFTLALDTMPDNISDVDAFLAISRLIAVINCDHTSAEAPPHIITAIHKQNILPFEFKFIGKRMYVLKNYADTSLKIGTEILSIEGESIAEIVDKIFPTIPSDGFITTSKYRTIERYLLFNVMYTLLRGNKSSYKIEYKSVNNNISKVITIKGKRLTTMRSLFKEQVNKEPIPFKIIIDKLMQTATITITTFDQASYKEHKQNFKKLLKKSFTAINQDSIAHLIIDIRNNGGGEADYGAHLYSYLTNKNFKFYEQLSLNTTTIENRDYIDFGLLKLLWVKLLTKRDKSSGRYIVKGNTLKNNKPAKNNFSGKVYVLINGLSYSASSEFCTIANDNKRATFIGEEGGGAYQGNTSGFSFTLTLPNSGVQIDIPVIHYQMAISNKYKIGRGLIPDYEVIPTIKELISGEDSELEKAKQLIKEH
tara:strand:- start:1396 stop:2847 length:1452 start_codon:yes stop_codon:yes gene_type:complete